MEALMQGHQIRGCDGAPRLLLQTLASGPHGPLAALRVLQSLPGPFPWRSLTEMLCMEEPILDGPAGKLTLKPTLLLLPLLVQRNLFSFLSFAMPHVPTPCLRLLAGAVSGVGDSSDPWLLALSRQLLTETEMQTPTPSTLVTESLQILCRGLCWPGRRDTRLGWCTPSPTHTTLLRKRKLASEGETLPLAEGGPHVKRVCTEGLGIDSPSVGTLLEELKEGTEGEEGAREELPEHLKVYIPRLKELLQGDLDSESWDESSQADLQGLCESCDPVQLQSLFFMLGVSQLPPQSLLQLCSRLNALSPDLSYAHSVALANSLFLEQVLSLSSPAPRPLLAALSLFCMKYARSACCALIGPLLHGAETGSAHTDFLCRMVSECLQSEQLSLVFSPVLEVPCCEGSITVLHTLLERQAVPSRSEFNLLLLSLCHSVENFSKSVKFSKLLLTIMTRNQHLVLPSHFGPLINAVNSNETFLKKSLQGALKKMQKNIA
ncbi:Fanconi anemia group E protein isoform X1 [Ascaphus truei]|uniref:Fanconi anemia group E protein isoform X1 n=2 Tax=Ascaphus truei TaxID=8439 RepID=UPI003F5A5CEC